jgi:lysophospholipase L1-like esterase
MRGPHRFLSTAGLLLLGAVVALALAEAAARLLRPSPPGGGLRGLHEFRPDRPWLYGLRPGAEGRVAETGDALYRINADGFRGPRHARPKPAASFRVVVVGDSVAFGYGVAEADAFPRLLESRLAELAPAAGIEVVNLGVGGYNAWNEAELLADVGASYQPDLVLVQFCINDLNDPTIHFDAQTRLVLSAIPDAAFPDASRRLAPRHAPSRLRAWCAASRLCTLARDGWLAARARDFDDADKRAAVRPVETQDGPEWRWLEARYLEMDAVARRLGARFAVLAMPHPAQLERSGPDPVQERLRELGRRHGWTVIDPLPAFRAAHAAGTRLFLDWWHPTPEGHRLAAADLLESLACAGELGEPARAACSTPAAGERAAGG